MSPSEQTLDPGRSSLRSPSFGIQVFLVIMLGMLAYSNTFRVPFIFDDLYSIVDNPAIQDLEEFLGGNGYRKFSSRFIGYLTFALNYHFGGLDVTGYHVFNLAVHLISALLVYALVRLTFRTPFLRDSTLAPRAEWVALLAALLFVVHPVQTQAVTYIVQRLASLATMFYLLSLVLYIQARLRFEARGPRTEDRGQRTEGGGRRLLPPSVFRPLSSGFFSSSLVTWLLLAGSVISAVLAMKSKEIAFTLPLMAALYEMSFFEGYARKRLLMLLPLLPLMIIIPFRLLSGHVTGDLLPHLEEAVRGDTDMPRLHYLFTQFRVIVTYLRLLVLPVNQNLDYDYPIYTSFFTPPVLLSFLLLAGLLVLAVYLYGFRFQVSGFKKYQSPVTSHQSRQLIATGHESRLIGFGLLWFFLALSVESSVIPIDDVINEHRLYLPSIGAFIAFSGIAARLFFRRSPVAQGVMLGAIVLILAGTAWKRNNVWQSNLSLWQDVVKKSPGKGRPHEYLGYTLLNKRNDVDGAIEELLTSLRLEPRDLTVRHTLGVAYMKKGWFDQAIEQFRMAIKLKPDAETYHYNLAVALYEKGLVEESIHHYLVSLELDPQNPTAHYNVGVAYGMKGKIQESIGHFQKAIHLRADYAKAYYNLGATYDMMGEHEQARLYYEKAFKYDPGLKSGRK